MSLTTLLRNWTAPFRGLFWNAVDVDPYDRKPKPMITKIPALIAKIALGEHWVRESTKNRGEGIQKYWGATSYKDGYDNREPYCAAFVAWVVREAFAEAGLKETPGFRLPKTPRAWGFEHWSESQDFTTNTKKKPHGDIERGDLIIFTFSHIGIALGRPDKNGRFATIEANTDGEGTREGDGVYEKIRHTDLVRSRIRFTV